MPSALPHLATVLRQLHHHLPVQPDVHSAGSSASCLRAVRLLSRSSSFMRSTIECFQSSFCPTVDAFSLRIAATSMDAAAPPLGTFAVWVPAGGVAVSALAVSVPAPAVLVGEPPAVAPGFPGAPAAGAAS